MSILKFPEEGTKEFREDTAALERVLWETVSQIKQSPEGKEIRRLMKKLNHEEAVQEIQFFENGIEITIQLSIMFD